MKYDFDEIINRHDTLSLKWDLEKHDGDILPMWVADMDFRTAKPIREAIAKRAEEGIFGYSIFSDDVLDAVIGWFRKRHNWEINREWLTYSQGIVPALHAFSKIFVKPGEKILMLSPVYYPFTKAAERNGIETVCSDLIYKNGKYEINFDDFRKKAEDPAVKMCFFCTPHNPGGRIWTREELTKVGRICTDNGVLIIADEIHCDIVYPGNTHVSFGTLDEDIVDNSIICTSPTKTFNLAGLQISNLVIKNPNLKEKYENYILSTGFDIDTNEASLFGIIAVKAAYEGGEEWLDQLIQYLNGNLDFLVKYVTENIPGIRLMIPQATYLVWMDMTSYGIECHKLHERLKNEGGIWLDEGYIFGRTGEGFERINIACPRSVLANGLERIKVFFEKL